jgi:hypothetical protein
MSLEVDIAALPGAGPCLWTLHILTKTELLEVKLSKTNEVLLKFPQLPTDVMRLEIRTQI